MKLKDEIPYVTERMRDLASTHDLAKYVEDVREEGGYKILRNRIAWDLIRAACKPAYLCGLYAKYNCDDSHITTLALRCMDDAGIIVG